MIKQFYIALLIIGNNFLTKIAGKGLNCIAGVFYGDKIFIKRSVSAPVTTPKINF
jgi:hypothetical protein